MAENHISDMVALEDDMIVSFINYELEIKLEKREISLAEQLRLVQLNPRK
jgi:hypothetical protein